MSRSNRPAQDQPVQPDAPEQDDQSASEGYYGGADGAEEAPPQRQQRKALEQTAEGKVTPKTVMQEYPFRNMTPGAERRIGNEIPLTEEGEDFAKTHQFYWENLKDVADARNRYFKVVNLDEHGKLFDLDQMGPFAFAEIRPGFSAFTRGTLNSGKPEQVLMFRHKDAQRSEQQHLERFHAAQHNPKKIESRTSKGDETSVGDELNQGEDTVTIENHTVGFETAAWQVPAGYSQP